MAELSAEVVEFLSAGTRTGMLGDPHPPYSFVQVQGSATATEDSADLLDVATRIGARYMGASRAGEFGRRNAVPGELLVRVRPTKVISAFSVAD